MIARSHTMACALALACTLSIAATVAGDYEVPWHTIGGGTTSTGGNYELAGTIGQPDAGGAMSGGSFSLTGGFWIPAESGCPPCPGDLDGDNVRDLTDFTFFAMAYGSVLGDASYDPCADMDDDGVVDLTDFSLFATNYGVDCP
jgi:hypothetical protein